MKTDCDKCNEYVNFTTSATADFLLKLVKDLKDTDCPKHLPPPAVMIAVFAAVGEVLGATIEVEIASIQSSDLPEEERNQECHEMVDAMTDAGFKILEAALPIEIHAKGGMAAGDTEKVMSFIEGLNAEQGEVQH